MGVGPGNTVGETLPAGCGVFQKTLGRVRYEEFMIKLDKMEK
jgi:hypothetical protein